MGFADAWMPVFIGDYLGATSHLTAEESGAYLHLLMHQWRAGSVPAEDARMAQIAHCTRGRWRKIAPTIMPFFSLVGGSYVQLRLDREREKTMKKSVNLTANIRKRWDQKRGGVLSENNGIADTDVSTDGLPKSTSSPSPSERRKEGRKDSAIAESKNIGSAGFAHDVDVFAAATVALPAAPPPAPPALPVVVEPMPELPPDPAPPPAPARAVAKRTEDASRGTRLPADWQPDAACVDFARNSGLDVLKEVEDFRDYWTSLPGARGRKIDWPATWRNHCRMRADRAAKWAKPRPPQRGKTDWMVEYGIIRDLPPPPQQPPAPEYDIDGVVIPENVTW